MDERITIRRSTVDIFFALVAVLVWILSYYLSSMAPAAPESPYRFLADILKDLGVVVAGLALVDWLWTLFSGDPLQRNIEQLGIRITGAIDLVNHARNAGVIRIDSSPTALDVGFPTDQFKDARHQIDLCGMTLHSLFARGNLTSALEDAVRRGCRIRVCIASPDNSAVLHNSHRDARAAMPGQSTAVINAINALRQSLAPDEVQRRLSLYVLREGVMMATISRIDHKMLVVPYLRLAFTMDSPAMLVEDKGPGSIFATYASEFEYLVKQTIERS
jgi:hypothetical protein